MKTVLLETGTVGTTDNDNVQVGDYEDVSLHDENGIVINEAGFVVEILD